MSENLELWERFYRTPPSVTEEFTLSNKPGAKVFNSIKPYYRVKCLHELFGYMQWRTKPLARWCETFDVPDYNGNPVSRTCVFVTLCIESCDEATGEWVAHSPHTGGTELAKHSRPDEAYKSAETDALGKCCADFGIGADIYDNVFDGDKYIAEQRSRDAGSAPSPQPTQAPHEAPMEQQAPQAAPQGGWRAWKVPIPGKNKGKTLGSLSRKSLEWYIENIKANPKYEDSVAFRKALDEAGRELNA